MDNKTNKKICGAALKEPLVRYWHVGRGVVADYRHDFGFGVVGGKLVCQKEVDENGKHKDGNPRHNQNEVPIKGKLDFYWD